MISKTAVHMYNNPFSPTLLARHAYDVCRGYAMNIWRPSSIRPSVCPSVIQCDV